MANIKLLVFDWDGTLADTTQMIVDSMQNAINQVKLPERNTQQVREIIGLGLIEAALKLFPDLPEDKINPLLDAYRGHYISMARGNTSLFPKVIETLEYFKMNNYFMAIATGKSRKGLINSLAETGISDYFDTTRCADETFSKPHPQMLHEIMQEMDKLPDETVMIGDSLHDVLMAQNANVRCFAVTSGTQSREQLQQLTPDRILDSIDELFCDPDNLRFFEA